ncbi:hypothetical protein J6590_048288 [Homalodisca vitripennis]|nr:hypothetical protein J6590_048288 [Homalodisca vitripennis]
MGNRTAVGDDIGMCWWINHRSNPFPTTQEPPPTPDISRVLGVVLLGPLLKPSRG